MNDQLRQMLDRMYREGKEFDATQSDAAKRRRNLDPDTAKLVSHMIRMCKAKRVVELGTSNGYSTVWFGDAVADTDGRLVTVDLQRQDDAIANAHWAGVSERIDFVHGDAGDYLAGLEPESVDVLFMDCARTEYAGWWPHPFRVLKPGGLLVFDNANSPAPDELTEFLELIDREPDLDLVVVPIGTGLGVALRRN